MKRLLIGVLLASSGLAFAADGPGCAKPEYAELHGADKADLKAEYCHMVRQAKSYEWSHQNEQETIAKKSELQLDTMKDRERSLEFLKAAGSCKVAAAYYEQAMSRRFKSKPPSSCE